MDTEALLARIADGKPHSGAHLAAELGVTRAAIWKHVAKLKAWGLEVDAAPGKGYRLLERIELLDAGGIRAALALDAATIVERIDVYSELGSTNRELIEREPPAEGRMHVCLAEYQTAGRGRRGRAWRTPFGGGLCLSVAWQFREIPPDLSALTLAVGVVARRVLEDEQGVAVELKWPNDLVWDERKLGGILLEMAAEAQGRCRVVAGLGINVAMPADLLEDVSDWRRGAVDLRRASGDEVSRNALAASLIGSLAALFRDYAETGFVPYLDEWRAADYLRGREVVVHESGGDTRGVAAGIEADGALLLSQARGRLQRVISGDVSVRTVQ